ncbi:MAG TPA: DUF3999 family protein [Terracidiphilus sp.]|nr:DUF3999 family protein [Terracidiphilus sp.]
MKIGVAIVLVAVAIPTPEIRYFASMRAVDLPAGAAGQACVALDREIFAGSARNLADVRLYRGTIETPYVIRNAETHRRPSQLIAALNPGRRAGRTVFDAAMPEGVYSDVELSVTGQDFLATVAVSGAQTETGKPTRIGSYTIFDFSRERLGRSTVLHLPRSDFRFLHFEIAGPVGPESVGGLRAEAEAPGEPKYVTVAQAGSLAQKGRGSTVEFTVPARTPVDRIVFTPPEAPVNFGRDVEIEVRSEPEGSGDAVRATLLSANASGNVLRIHRVQDGRHIDEERLAVDAPAEVFDAPSKWSITVENGDDAPVSFTGVRLEMLERDLCFEAAAGAAYTLYYGDEALSAPRYDYARWFAPQANAVVATLGAGRPNPAYDPRPDPRPFTERHPALLWVTLLVVVVFLGVVALRSARRMERPGPMP